MNTHASRRQSGFTLLEMLISLAIFLMALATIAVALDSNRGAYLRGERKIDVQQNARLALGEMTTQIRMAGYFPENFGSPAPSPPIANGIQIATDGALAIHGDADGTGASNVYLYCLDGGLLRRGKAPSGDATAYWCPAGEILAEHVTSLRFAYFDENNAPIPSTPTAPYQLDSQTPGSIPDLTNLAQRGAVRRVVLTLTVSQDVPGYGPQVFDLSSDVRLRNAS